MLISLSTNKLVDIIAPSGIINREKFLNGIDYLSRHSYTCRYDLNLLSHNYDNKAGTDAIRFNALKSALSSDADLIWAVRGGYGSTRLLDYFDQLKTPLKTKIIIGYSDITLLQFALYKFFGLKGISGHMIQVDFFDTDEKKNELNTLHTLINQQQISYDISKYECFYLDENIGHLKIIGGCLSVFSKLIGTPFMPDMTNHLLFIEDINEEIHKIDFYMSHLLHSGILFKISGLIIGQFNPPQSINEIYYKQELRKIFDYYIRKLKIPVIYDFPIGHIKHLHPLAIGYHCELGKDLLSIYA